MKKTLIKIMAAFVFSALLYGADFSTFISATDSPEGWASYNGTKNLAGEETVPPSAIKGTNGGEGSRVVVTVSNRQQLLDALTRGSSRIIYVKGIIDMTDSGKGSLLPQTVKGSTAELDAAIKELTKGSVLPCNTYGEWKTKYAGSFDYNEDQSGEVKDLRTKLNEFWRELTFLRIQPNTTIIGLDEESGITGGSWSIKEKKNVILRNLHITNCYNPFPKVEANDGLNADFDCIAINHSTYVWIDHCTIESKFSHDEVMSDKYKTKDGFDVKWQVYDGLCDITNTNDFVTVSWCVFRNHDKTMLIGNSDKKIEDINHQTITLHHNWYDYCTQRLPMVRFATLHIFNCLYTNQQSRGIDRRKDCRIYSENNCFEEPSKSVTTNKNGTLYDSGSINIRQENLTPAPEWKPSDYYKYTLEDASKVKDSVMKYAGNGKLTVKK